MFFTAANLCIAKGAVSGAKDGGAWGAFKGFGMGMGAGVIGGVGESLLPLSAVAGCCWIMCLCCCHT